MKRLLFVTAWIIVALTMNAQTTLPTETPQLEFALQLNVTLGQPYTVGSTPHGKRMVIPITGGTFEGPLLNPNRSLESHGYRISVKHANLCHCVIAPRLFNP